MTATLFVTAKDAKIAKGAKEKQEEGLSLLCVLRGLGVLGGKTCLRFTPALP